MGDKNHIEQLVNKTEDGMANFIKDLLIPHIIPKITMAGVITFILELKRG
jgi:hypothetical protein